MFRLNWLIANVIILTLSLLSKPLATSSLSSSDVYEVDVDRVDFLNESDRRNAYASQGTAVAQAKLNIDAKPAMTNGVKLAGDSSNGKFDYWFLKAGTLLDFCNRDIVDRFKTSITAESCDESVRLIMTRSVRLASFWKLRLLAYGEQQFALDETDNNPDGSTKVEDDFSTPKFEIKINPLMVARKEIIEYVTSQRALATSEGRTYRVLDVGGLSDSWSWGITNVIMDFKVVGDIFTEAQSAMGEKLPSTIRLLQGDITRESGWNEIMELVSKEGVFDFVICAHTIEDLHNPDVAVEMLSRVAKAGQIVVPSRFTEMGRDVSIPASHRMGFTKENGMAGR